MNSRSPAIAASSGQQFLCNDNIAPAWLDSRLAFLALGLALGLAASQGAHALPQNGQVVTGQGAIAQNGTSMTVTQTTPKLGINWQSFGIGAGETVNFVQPSSAAIALSRVQGQDPSAILGSLNANGQIFLINPNGILFAPGAQVNVGGLIASTNDMSDADFIAGQYRFIRQGNAAELRNQGSLKAADGGYIVLLGPNVSNAGEITARLGKVLLGGGDDVTVYLNSGSLVGYRIDQAGLDTIVANSGTILAHGGEVALQAGTLDQLSKAVVNNTGVIEAHTVENHQGVIRLLAGRTAGEVNLGGRLDASAPGGGDGGRIETAAYDVRFPGVTQIDTAAPQGKPGLWETESATFDAHFLFAGLALNSGMSSGNVTINTTEGPIVLGDQTFFGLGKKLNLNSHDHISLSGFLQADRNDLVLRADRYGTGVGEVVIPGMISTLGKVDVYYNPVSYTQTLEAYYNSKMVHGTANSWMLVNSAEQLQALNTNLAGNYALGRDIDASVTTGWNGGQGFVPIGEFRIGVNDPFTGKFDGLNHVIKDLHIFINRDYVGLFGYTSLNASIANVGLVGGSVGVAGNLFGALVGWNRGSIENVYSTVDVRGFNTVGGLVGQNTGSIINAYSGGSVHASQTEAGGLAGFNDGSIRNAYSDGAVTGTAILGGLLGANQGSVVDSYWDMDASGQSGSGGGISLTAAQMLDSANFAGFDPAVWRQYNGHGAPLLKSFLKPMTVSLGDRGKIYDGAGWSGTPLILFNGAGQAPDNLSVQAQAGASSRNVGSYASTPQLWSNQQGYDLKFAAGKETAQADIYVAPLTIAAVADSKVYDGGTTSAGTPQVSGLVMGDSVTGERQVFDSRNAGARTLSIDPQYTINDGNGGQNYLVTTHDAQGSITPRPLTIAAVVDNKVYDGGTASTGTPQVSGLATGDSVTGERQVFDSRNAGARTLSVDQYTLNDGNGGQNYLVSTHEAQGSITPKALTIAAVADSKVYDANTASAATPQVSGLVMGDSVFGERQVFDSRNAGVRTLSVDQYTVNDGNGGQNYQVSTHSAQGSITPRPLTIAAVTDSKVYDATATSTGAPQVTGLVGADSVSEQRQVFDAARAGARTLNVDRYTVNDGNGGQNYQVVTQSAQGTITPKTLQVQAQDLSLPYSGRPFAGGNGVRYEGFVAGEGSADLGGALSYGGSSQGAIHPGDYPIVPGGLASGNYAIVYQGGELRIQQPSQLLPALADARAKASREQATMQEEQVPKTVRTADGLQVRIVGGGMLLPPGLE